MFKWICSVQETHCLETTYLNVFVKHNADTGNSSTLTKPLPRVPGFSSSCSYPALRVHYHHTELMCSVLLSSQHNAMNKELCEQLLAQLINPAVQLLSCLWCKHNPTVPLSLCWQRMSNVNATITSKPHSSPHRSSFFLNVLLLLCELSGFPYLLHPSLF